MKVEMKMKGKKCKNKKVIFLKEFLVNRVEFTEEEWQMQDHDSHSLF